MVVFIYLLFIIKYSLLTFYYFYLEQPIKEQSESPRSSTGSPEPNGINSSSDSIKSPEPAVVRPLGTSSTLSDSGGKQGGTSPQNTEIRKIGTPTRARSGTTSTLPNRMHRHSAYSSTSNTLPNPNTIAGKQAKSGRVLRYPTDNAEIILNERVGKGKF